MKLPLATTAATLLALAAAAGQDSMAQAPRRPHPVPLVSSIEAPVGTETLGVDWIKVAAPDLGTMLAAVARPSGTGPFPTVVLLHGRHGFAREYVQLAQAFAREGLIAVAPCWFAAGDGAGVRFVTPIACPDAPAIGPPLSPLALRTVDALLQAAGALPGARRERVGLFGHSRGGGTALHYTLDAGRVGAAVLSSAGYPSEFTDRAARVDTPILILHGTADSPADGGSEFTNVQRARDFEAALRRAGKPVEAMYYDGGRHNGVFTDSMQHDDEVRRAAAFLRRHLRDDTP